MLDDTFETWHVKLNLMRLRVYQSTLVLYGILVTSYSRNGIREFQFSIFNYSPPQLLLDFQEKA